jgi:hypothetical protein
MCAVFVCCRDVGTFAARGILVASRSRRALPARQYSDDNPNPVENSVGSPLEEYKQGFFCQLYL